MERIEKINKVFREELSRVILKELDFRKGVLVTIIKVETTKDLNQCKVFVSVFPEEDKKEILKILNKSASFLKDNLNKRISLRKIPKPIFQEEKLEKKTLELDRLLNSLE